MNRKVLLASVSLLIAATLAIAACYTYHVSLPVTVQSEIEQGQISQDTVFSAANSPYKITRDVLVHPEVTLTIEPGVTILLSSNCSLIVSGSLNASGTENSKIVFASSDPNSAVWGALKFTGNLTEFLTLKCVEISNATNGVEILSEENGNILIEKCSIHHNQDTGIKFLCRSDVAIKNCLIVHNGNGILGYGNSEKRSWSNPYPRFSYLSYVYLEGNTIQFNLDQGVLLHCSNLGMGQIHSVWFLNNNVSDNGGNGIKLISRGDMGTSISEVNFTSNSITRNGGSGIVLDSADWDEANNNEYSKISRSYLYNVSFTFNTIILNKGAGVYVRAGNHENTTEYDATFILNSFAGNLKEGLLIEGAITSSIKSNQIRQNGVGISYNRTQCNLATTNILSENAQGMLVFNNATVEGQGNFWGDPTGPYHSTLNPHGKGNGVNGNGTDLQFTPYLTYKP